MKLPALICMLPTVALIIAGCESRPSAVAGLQPIAPRTDTVTTPVGSTGPTLTVVSFRVVEYRPTCVWDCPYIAYAPLLELHESSGQSVEVTSIEFRLGSKTTGDCRGSVVYAPNASGYLDGVYEYLWSNDLIFVSLDGQPIRDSVATARATVRAHDGTERVIEAAGTVQRMVSNPTFPSPRPNGWVCAGSA